MINAGDPTQIVEEQWRRVLGRLPKSLSENFFEAGGSSLSAAELMAGISQAVGWRVRLADLVARPTPGELAALLRERAN